MAKNTSVPIFLIAASMAVGAWADDQTLTDGDVAVRTEEGHQLLLPKDWPIEHKDGRIAPVPMEAYLSLKFGQVKEGFGKTDQRIDALERRVEALEKGQQELLKGLRVLERQQREVSHGDTAQNP